MPAGPSDDAIDDATPNTPSSFLTSIDAGALQWGEHRPFARPSAAEEEATKGICEEIGAFLRAEVDPEEVDAAGVLPKGLIGELRERGHFRLRNDTELGGAGLSDYAAFRACEHAATWSTPIGQLLAIQNAVGAAALLSALPTGPLHDFVRRRVAEGAISAFAGTEPAGANNAWPGTTATLSEDGAAYILEGEKLFIGNGDIAELLALTVALPGEQRSVGVAFTDTDVPGFSVPARLEFLGSRGLPNAAVRLDGVRIPREHVLAGTPGEPRFPPSIGPVALLSALFFNAAPALAIARQCAGWTREFLARRTIDGRPLGGHEAVQRLVAETAADVHAIDSVVRWCLVGAGPGDRWLELSLAKNICTTLAWRTVDRTVSLLGGEGVETAAGKRRRGATASPVERLLRDARMLRISGNVDFLLDIQAGRLVLSRYTDGAPDPGGDAGAMDLDGLSAANRDHVHAVADGVRRLARTCAEPAPGQHVLGLIGGITAELFTMTAVLSRTATDPDPGVQELADAHCAFARDRLGTLWRGLETHGERRPDHASITWSLLDGGLPTLHTDIRGARP